MLVIDTNSQVWRDVAEHLARRIQALSEVCCSTTSSDSQRFECAARIEELKDLLKAPERMRISAQQREGNPSTEVY